MPSVPVDDFDAEFAERYQPSLGQAPPNIYESASKGSSDVSSTDKSLPPVAVPGFTPRSEFPVSDNTRRSYFLGHHAAALKSMRNSLGRISMIIECRDFRLPLTCINPELNKAVAERPRIIVYTKCDLVAPGKEADRARRLLKHWHLESGHAHDVIFHAEENTLRSRWGRPSHRSTSRLLDAIKELRHECEDNGPLGARAMVVGMPNTGKSTLMNVLRAYGMAGCVQAGDKGSRTVHRDGKTVTVHKKAARTAAQPGVTRKMSGPVRILPRIRRDEEAEEDDDEGVMLHDTPGVFVPYVSDPEAMVKLALVGMVKDNLIHDEIVADYLLFRLNQISPRLYSDFSEPTNDVNYWLERIAKRTGKLGPKATLLTDNAAAWIIARWRRGHLGKFMLDNVTKEAVGVAQRKMREPPLLSIREARLKLAEEKREKALLINATA